jgi:hypothetical protein
MTFTNFGCRSAHWSSTRLATVLPVAQVVLDEAAHQGHLLGLGQRLQAHQFHVAAVLGEVALLVQHVGDAADMPAAKLRPVLPSTTTMPPVMYSQPWSPTPSTTVLDAAVAHRETFARQAADVGLAA